MAAKPPVTTGPAALGPRLANNPARFTNDASNGELWLVKARALREAAVAVLESIRNGRPAPVDSYLLAQLPMARHDVVAMLWAAALENLLKGVVVQRDASAIVTGKRATRRVDFGPRGGHDLVDLSRRAGLTLDREERDVLEYGTEATLSFGRFAVARQSDMNVQFRFVSQPGYSDTCDALFKRIGAQLLGDRFDAGRAHPDDRALSRAEYIALYLEDAEPRRD